MFNFYQLVGKFSHYFVKRVENHMSTLAYRPLIKFNSNYFPLKMKMATIIMSLLAATASVV
jgi:hypothetical protein